MPQTDATQAGPSLPASASPGVSGAVFATYAIAGVLIILPAAIANFHLYADGGYIFAQLFASGRVVDDGTHARVVAHGLMQFPVLIALKCGITNVRILSWVFGLTLFGLPLACYVASSWLSLRRGMPAHAILTTILYCILLCWTSFFAVTESHLAAGLFVLCLAILSAGDLSRRSTLLTLVAVSLLALCCYESWAIFFPVTILLFLARVRRTRLTPSSRILGLLFLAVCVAGAGWNLFWAVRTPYVENRNALFGAGLSSVLPILVACGVLFVGILLASSEWVSRLCRRRLAPAHGHFLSARCGFLHDLEFWLPLGFAAILASPFALLPGAVVPGKAYDLRSLNVLLPLLFALFLWLERTGTARRQDTIRLLLCCMLFFLSLGVQSHLTHTLEWLRFEQRLRRTAQEGSGWISVNDIPGLDRSYGWRWTYPTMSLLLLGMNRVPARAVVYHPDAEWQPFGPNQAEDAERLAGRLGIPYLLANGQEE
jgi:hypothetical protein